MVKVRQDRPVDAEGHLDIPSWIKRIEEIAHLPADAAPMLTQACEVARKLEFAPGDKLVGWGESYSSYSAGLEMAEILAGLQLDKDTLAAAILYRSLRENKYSPQAVEKTSAPPLQN
jgi:GTP pyrophosphokinase